MAATFCTSGSVKLKAGSNVSSVITDAQYTEMINQAESDVNTESKFNWTDVYSGLNDDLKKVLEEAAASKAAVTAISYDMKNYFSKEAEIILDVNWATYKNATNKLKQKQYVDFVRGG